MRLLRMSAIFLGERYYIKIYIISSLCFHFCTLPLLFCLTSAFCLLCAASTVAAARNELRSRHSGLTTFIDNHAPQISLSLFVSSQHLRVLFFLRVYLLSTSQANISSLNESKDIFKPNVKFILNCKCAMYTLYCRFVCVLFIYVNVGITMKCAFYCSSSNSNRPWLFSVCSVAF